MKKYLLILLLALPVFAQAQSVTDRLDTLEAGQVVQDNSISILQGEQAVQNDRLDALEDLIAQLHPHPATVQINELIVLASPVQAAYEDFMVANNGAPPGSPGELPEAIDIHPPTFDGCYAIGDGGSVTHSTGSIHLFFDSYTNCVPTGTPDPELLGKTIELIPTWDGSSVTGWVCKTFPGFTIDSAVLPAGCTN